MAVYEDHPEDAWEEIDQADWEEIVLRVDDEGTWHLRFEYENEFGDTVGYSEEEITWDEFLDIYDEAADLDQELEIEY
jgi:hypothetical protein